jgi:hypothetical protein
MDGQLSFQLDGPCLGTSDLPPVFGTGRDVVRQTVVETSLGNGDGIPVYNEEYGIYEQRRIADIPPPVPAVHTARATLNEDEK